MAQGLRYGQRVALRPPRPKLVSMELDDASEEETMEAMPVEAARPRFPYGLRICLTEVELDKLGLGECGVGDMIDMRCFGTVTSVSMNDDADGGRHCRVEIQIESVVSENELLEPEMG